jgi:predicted dehydrogenase
LAALKSIPGVEVVAVCDLDERAARECATRHGIRGCYTDLESMMREARLDVVHLLTPPQSHAALARIVTRYRAHLYIEKPLASGEPDAQLILNLAREAGVQACPGHSRLFDPVFVEACRRVRIGEIGRIVSVRAEQAGQAGCAHGRDRGVSSSVLPATFSLLKSVAAIESADLVQAHSIEFVDIPGVPPGSAAWWRR